MRKAGRQRYVAAAAEKQRDESPEGAGCLFDRYSAPAGFWEVAAGYEKRYKASQQRAEK